MSWLLFYILVLAYPFLYIYIWKRIKNWSHRLILWGLLSIAAVAYCWDYFYIEREHERMCQAEGGLKVFIQPEKTDRVRYMWRGATKMDAEGVFNWYFPHARVVEIMTENRSTDGRILNSFVAYTAVPKTEAPRPVEWYKELPYVLNIQPLDQIDPNVYEISKKSTSGKYYWRQDLLLTRNGQMYARYTTFEHYWTGIRYPDGVPRWRCPNIWGLAAPPDNSKATLNKRAEQKNPDGVLRSLIFEFPKY